MEGERSCSHTTPNKTTNKFEDLPEELIPDILLRLPVKSLLKLKYVSNSWLSLISSPEFVKAHLELSSRNADFTNGGILFSFHEYYFNPKQCSISSLMSESLIVASDVDFPHRSMCLEIWVLGSCNGIVCIASDEKDIFLSNPSTRKSKALPSVEVEESPDLNHTWGFGYSESDDDYKVVGMYEHDNGSESIVMIYSLRNNSWKRIEDFKFGTRLGDAGRFASGKLHFATIWSIEEISKVNIVSVDLKTEAYGFVQQPNYGDDCFESYFRTLGGCLSVICNCEKTGVDVWVLKDYGVKESWTRMVSIPYPNDADVSFYYLKPLLVMLNGEILLFLMESLVIYNPKDSSFKYPQISNLHEFLQAEIYVESLVSL